MNKLIAFAIIIMTTGCAGLTTGKYPYPVGIDVDPINKSIAKVDLADYEAAVQIEGYTPDIGLIGIVVPVIPIGQWKWLTGISKDDLRITANLIFKPKTKSGIFEAGSLKIIVNEQQYFPSEIRMASHCETNQNSILVDTSKPLPIKEQICVRFIFKNLHPPDTQFVLAADGLPDIKYVLERKTRYEFFSPRY